MKKILILALLFFSYGKSNSQTPQLKVQTGHGSFVSSMAFTSDGNSFISAGIDGQIKIWETASGREIASVNTKLPMYDMEITGDASTAVIADFYGNITAWDLKTGEQLSIPLIKHVPTHLPQLGIAAGLGLNTQVFRPISVSGDNLVVANEGDAMANILKLDKLIGLVTIFDVKTGKKKVSFKQKNGAVSAISFANNKKIVTVDVANNINLWDAEKGKEILSFSSGQTKVLSVSANDKYIATGGAAGSLKVWDMNTGKNLYTFSGHNNDLVDVSVSGEMLVSTDKNSAKIWDLSNGTEVFDNKVENTSGAITNICNVGKLSADNSMVATSLFGTINLYDSKSGIKLRTFEGSFGGLIGNIFMPGTTDPAMVFMTRDGIVAKRWRYPNNETTSIDVNVAGKYVGTHPNLESIIVFAPGIDKTVPIYDIKKEKILCELTGHTAPVYNATYSNDGKRIVTGSQDNTIRIWDVTTGKELDQISRRGFAVTGFNGKTFLSNDYKTILTMGLGTAPTQIWDLESKRSINLTGVNFTGTPTISPDGKLIAGTGAIMTKKGSAQEFVVFDTSNGKRVGSFKGNIGSMYMSFSADSKCIAIAMEDGVHVIDIATEELKYKLPHFGVYHFAFSDDNSQLMTYSLIDGMSRLWNYETGEEIAGLVSFRADENTIVLPNRYYYSTKGAVKGIHYVMDNKAIPFDQFDLQYNRPDIVFEALGVSDKNLLDGYKKAYLKRLVKNKVTEEMFSDDFHLPEVSIEKNNIPITSTNKKLTINFTAKDSKYNLTKVELSVNNIPIYGKTGLVITGNTQNFNQEIELSEGRNKIGVIAINEKGVKSIEEVVEIQYTGEASKPNLYILAIGVSEYKSSEMNLTYAAKDASDLISAFESNGENYENITILKYLNQEATTSNILQSKEILQKSKVNDEVVVFVAGHGLLDANLDYYLATHDVDFLNPSTKGLKYENLEGLLDGIPARKKVMFLDACHSGEVDKEAKGEQTASSISTTGNVKFRGFNSSTNNSMGLQNSFKMMQELFADLRRGTGAVVISSASGAEYAFESPEWNNGVFTYSLLEGLKSGNCDENEDGEIRMSELRNYVMTRVAELTNGNQHPTSRNENLEFDFKIW